MDDTQEKQKERMNLLETFYAKQPYVIKFGDFTLNVEKDVFPPDLGFTTHHLSKSIKGYSGLTNALDMGCGTGILALTLKRGGAKNVWAVDVHEPAVECTRKNVSLHPELQPIYVLKSDLFSELDHGVKFDFIVFNQPYFPLKEKGIFGGNPMGGKSIIELFFAGVQKFLADKGRVVMPYSTISSEEHNPQKVALEKGYTSKIIDKITNEDFTHYIYEFSR